MINEKELYSQLTSLFDLHNEWLLIHQTGKTFALGKNEFEIERDKKRILFGFLDEKGFQTWRVSEAEIVDQKVSFKLTRNFQKDETHIEIIPRVKAEFLGETVELARLEKSNKIGFLLASETEQTKLKRVELNRENGRFAEILLEKRAGNQIAVLADVSDSLTPEILLSSMILWLRNLAGRKKNPVKAGWIVCEKRVYANVQKLHACLRESWKRRIEVKRISRKAVRSSKKESVLGEKSLRLNDLWSFKPAKLNFETGLELSEIAREIIKLSPEKIDYQFTRKGETLRYLGLPFVRVRKMFDEEKAWFGIENKRRILKENSYEDFYELFENIRKYRRFDSPNKQHLFYKNAPEAWLESLFRKNIKLLDANLFLSPIHNQFRTIRDKIDLLALRQDGRLIIIELKVSPDREMIYQAVEYWRKIELQRRQGILQESKIFGKLKIADKPTIIYLVAPTLSFHRDFNFLAKTISPEIGIYRFDLTENWRENLKVLGRR